MPLTLLLADASPHARRMAELYLADLGYGVLAAADGPAALQLLDDLGRRQAAPSLILADANLPGLPGLELCREIKQRPEWRSIPFLLLLGALAPAASEEHFAPADGVLRKPLSSAGLQRWLQPSPDEWLERAVYEAALGSGPETDV